MTDDTEKAFEQRQQRLGDKRETSGRIGETTRFIAFGIIALVFTIHGSDSAIATGIITRHEALLNAAGLVACLSVLSDYLQYVCGYFSVDHALTRKDNAYTYDSTTWVYRGRSFFFWAKQVLAFLGAAIVVGLMSGAMISGS
ncbi:hypothetical protein [Roseivivax sp. THAF30]|uniref:hypothetical protein n=1 Tax=Roseivivax sp. THAF30 TaxID=2587852 RepID=UPI00126926BC|nr:hypothetical protein [Roseivivax sp. THAF30]QFT61824.1 hypothetical protein FIU91_02690 [Roseivivax sp. THAF30]